MDSSQTNQITVWGTPINRLYDGLLPALVGGVISGAVFFGVKDLTKSILIDYADNMQATAFAVAVANIPYWVIRSPLEVLKTRQQTGEKPISSFYLLHSMIDMVGPTGAAVELYKTYVPNVLYSIPADISKFVAYEVFTDLLYGRSNGSQKLDGLDGAVAGALASLISQLLTTPLDVARTRMMVDTRKENGENVIDVVFNISENEGFGGLFRGSGPRILRALCSGAIQFFVYETTQNSLRR